MAKFNLPYNPQNEEPDAYDADGNKTVNSWKLFMEDEMASDEYNDSDDDGDSSFLDGLGMNDDELSYAKYCWDKSEEQDRRRGL